MRGDTRCIDGTVYVHLPQNDDPDFEVAKGRCPECEGNGCRQVMIAAAEARIGERIKTHFEYPPVPFRDHDWCAVTDNYDGEGSPIGWGRTEEDAVNDLLDQIEERAQ